MLVPFRGVFLGGVELIDEFHRPNLWLESVCEALVAFAQLDLAVSPRPLWGDDSSSGLGGRAITYMYWYMGNETGGGTGCSLCRPAVKRVRFGRWAPDKALWDNYLPAPVARGILLRKCGGGYHAFHAKQAKRLP